MTTSTLNPNDVTANAPKRVPLVDDPGSMDPDTQQALEALADHERLVANRIPGVKTVMVVLSSRGMAFDVEALRQKILSAYPDAAVFFRSTSGAPLGVASPQYVDLLIDLTVPGQRQPLFYARKLRKMSRFAVGRKARLFRGSYDRLFDEKSATQNLSGQVRRNPGDTLEMERFVQKAVLALAGVPLTPTGERTPDRGKLIALELPRMSQQ